MKKVSELTEEELKELIRQVVREEVIRQTQVPHVRDGYIHRIVPAPARYVK